MIIEEYKTHNLCINAAQLFSCLS